MCYNYLPSMVVVQELHQAGPNDEGKVGGWDFPIVSEKSCLNWLTLILTCRPCRVS